jgi:hypothetical protein
MAIAGTIPVTAPIAPTAAADNYASHIDIYGKGGFRAVADNTERDAIPSNRRLEGMWVYVIATGLVWRLAADLTTWNAVSIAGQRYRSMAIPASAMTSTFTNGADTFTDESTTYDRTIDKYLFDQATEESVQFQMPMPQEWDLGTLKFKIYWTATSGSGDVIWGVKATSMANDDAIDGFAWGTEIETTDTLITANDIHICTSAALTVGNTPAADDWVAFQISRKAAAGGDSLNADAHLIAVSMQWHELATDSGSW